MLVERFPADHDPVDGEEWAALVEAFSQIERLAGGQIPRARRWADLRRISASVWALTCTTSPTTTGLQYRA